MTLLRLLLTFACLAWAAISFLFLAAASIPYQDATPAMLDAQASEIGFWKGSLFLAALVAVASVVSFRRARRKRS